MTKVLETMTEMEQELNIQHNRIMSLERLNLELKAEVKESMMERFKNPSTLSSHKSLLSIFTQLKKVIQNQFNFGLQLSKINFGLQIKVIQNQFWTPIIQNQFWTPNKSHPKSILDSKKVIQNQFWTPNNGLAESKIYFGKTKAPGFWSPKFILDKIWDESPGFLESKIYFGLPFF